jgi:hypothetical protein
MKTRLLFLVLSCCSISLWAQNFVSTDNLWYEQIYGFTGLEGTIIYQFGDEVVVDGKTYLVLQTTGDSTLQDFEATNYAYREDGEGLVYRVAWENPDGEELVYDFGDGMEYADFYWACDGLFLDTTETITLNNNTTADVYQYAFPSLPDAIPVIQNVGAWVGTFDPEINCATDAPASLQCFWKDGELLYGGEPCFLAPNAVSDLKNEWAGQLTPNLLTVGEQVMLDLPEPLEVHLLHINGQRVASRSLSGTQYWTLDKPGIWLFVGVGESGALRFRERVVVTGN